MTSCNLGNWNEACENQVNEQINMEYWASYQYHLMWSYFDRSSVGMKNIAEFFRKASEEEREHAHQQLCAETTSFFLKINIMFRISG